VSDDDPAPAPTAAPSLASHTRSCARSPGKRRCDASARPPNSSRTTHAWPTWSPSAARRCERQALRSAQWAALPLYGALAACNVPVVAAQAKPNANFGGSTADGTGRLALLTSYKTVKQLAAQDLSPHRLATLKHAHAVAASGPPGVVSLLPEDLETYATPNSPL
jgi:hypothetical protein